MEEYKFKRLCPETLADLVFLMKTNAYKRVSRAYYQKKYSTPGAGGQYHGWLAYEKSGKLPVAAVAALPFYAAFPDGRTAPASQLAEAYTLSAHAKRGLMTTLIKKTIEDQHRAGVHLIYVFANQNSMYGSLNKWGFSRIGQMERFEQQVATFPLEALCRRCRLPGLFRWWAKRILAPYLAPKGFALENSVLAEGYAGVVHDEPFYAYKSFSFNCLCRFSGIDSWLKFENGLLVGDAMLPADCPDAQFDAWLSTVQKIARRAGLRKIIFQTHTHARLYEKLSTRMPAHPSWVICCQTNDAVLRPAMEKMRFVYGDFDTF